MSFFSNFHGSQMTFPLQTGSRTELCSAQVRRISHTPNSHKCSNLIQLKHRALVTGPTAHATHMIMGGREESEKEDPRYGSAADGLYITYIHQE